MDSDKGKAKEVGPLWDHMENIVRLSGSGGNRNFTCKYCKGTFKGTYTRVRAHLLRIQSVGILVCPAVDSVLLERLKKIDEMAEKRKEIKEVQSGYTSNLPLPNVEEFGTKKRKGDGGLSKYFNVAARDELDSLIARNHYANALSFNLMRSPYYRDMIKFACNNQLHGYIPPTYDKLRTSLLVAEKANVELHLKPIKQSWVRKGVSIVSDGWTDTNRKKSLINFMAASENGPVFLKAIDATERVKNAEYIASLFLDVIEEVGPTNVVQIITDNASVCKAAGARVEEKYGAIFWTPCVVHSINLALKAICTPEENGSERYDHFQWIGEIDRDVKLIRNFIVNHSSVMTIYSKYSKLKLLGVTETRFASTLILVKRIFHVKAALMQMVVDPDWKNSYRLDDRDKAQAVKGLLLNDLWWDKMEYLLNFTNPIVAMLRDCDTDKPMLHKVYEKWDSMIEEVQKIVFNHEGKNVGVDESSFFDELHRVLVERWDKSSTPLHCLAHSLNPKFYSEEWLAGGIGRTPPHLDEEISQGRNACLEKLFSNPTLLSKVLEEYGRFCTSTGNFGKWQSLSTRYSSDPLSWWGNQASCAPTLASIAFRLLGQPASSSCCERNWSTFGMISSIKRNRLLSPRAEDLVYIHSNLRLLSRKQEDYYKDGPTKYWDVGGDQVNLDGSPELELANLSLDDPCLESVNFDMAHVIVEASESSNDPTTNIVDLE